MDADTAATLTNVREFFTLAGLFFLAFGLMPTRPRGVLIGAAAGAFAFAAVMFLVVWVATA
jgi:hypothetical protein